MYPSLTDFFREVLGLNILLPVQTYGFFVALSFLLGVWVLILEFKRKEREGIFGITTKEVIVGKPAQIHELLLSGIVGFVIGYFLVGAAMNYKEFATNPQEFLTSLNGSALGGLAFAAISIFTTWRDKNKQKLPEPKKVLKEIHPHQLAGNILVVAGVFGLLGAKIFHNLEYIDEFMADPWEALISFSGLTFLGGLILGSAAVFYYLKKYYKLSIIHLLDVLAIVMPLTYAVGRLGCLTAGDGCWGIPNPNPMPELLAWLPDWIWAYDFPNNIIKDAGQIFVDGTWVNAPQTMMEGCDPAVWNGHCYKLATPVYPTPFYEFSIMLIGFLGLWFTRKRFKTPGLLFGIYLIIAGLERFFVEKIRVNSLYKVGGFEFTQAELISSIMAIGGIIVIFIVLKNRNKLKNIKAQKP